MPVTSQPALNQPTRTSILSTIAILGLVIAGLIIADTSLERAEQKEFQSQAQLAFADGSRLLKQGKPVQAVNYLQKAYALERGNVTYELELMDALIAAGKAGEAEAFMSEVLAREPDNGRANLSAARLMLKRNRPADAVSYYHRAIYGEWADNAPSHRIEARLELIHLLVDQGRHQELLAELLPLQEEAAKNEQIQRSVAHLFLTAGSPSRASDAYRAMIGRNAKDGEAYAGLGEAELEQGRYRAAHSAFTTALHYAKDDGSISSKLELAKTLSDIDPTQRRLTSEEKYRRSLRILELANGALTSCMAKQGGTPTSDTVQIVGDAQAALAKENPPDETNEVSEGLLGLAQRAWAARLATCGTPIASNEDALRLIMENLAQ